MKAVQACGAVAIPSPNAAQSIVKRPSTCIKYTASATPRPGSDRINLTSYSTALESCLTLSLLQISEKWNFSAWRWPPDT